MSAGKVNRIRQIPPGVRQSAVEIEHEEINELFHFEPIEI
jgi:hypothetical protein